MAEVLAANPDTTQAVYDNAGRLVAYLRLNPGGRWEIYRPSVMGSFPNRLAALNAALQQAPGEYIQNVHNEANANGDRQAEVVKAAGTALGQLAVGDYQHWHGPRGASATASIREATDGIKRLSGAVAEVADREFVKWLYSEEGPFGRGEIK